jgi:UDP-N-acetylglucosamine transferase subunit ALG13
MLQKINYRFINQFNVCWVPDRDRGKTLAGKLSHPFRFPNVSVEYIGLLSRFEKKELPMATIDLLVILSGPEPQRSIFEEIVLRELTGFAGKCVLVRGLPNEKETGKFSIETYNHLPSDELNRLFCAADLIISRAGYSSIMDIIKLGKKSILVPTPGQPEQQFLAQHLAENSFAVSANQNDFSLTTVLEIARQFNFITPGYDDGLLLKSAMSNLRQMMG